MEQQDPKQPQTPQAPQKFKRPPAPTENLLQNPGTPKKPKVFFSPVTPAIPTPEAPTFDEAFNLTSMVESQLGNVILISGRKDPEEEEEEREEEREEEKKRANSRPARIWQKEPFPAEKQTNTYRGLTQHLLALLRASHEYSPLKLAQLKGLTQVLSGIVSRLTMDKVKPEKISKIKKIALLLSNFIQDNASPEISESQFKKNSLTFYIRLRFNQNQQDFLIQLVDYLNTSDEHDDSIQAHIDRTTQNIQAISQLLLLLKKNGADFQQLFLKFIEKRRSYFDIRFINLNSVFLTLKNAYDLCEANHIALDAMLFKEKSKFRELQRENTEISKELDDLKELPEQDFLLYAGKKEELERKISALRQEGADSKKEIKRIQAELKILENDIDKIDRLKRSFKFCIQTFQEIEDNFKNIQSNLNKNRDQLNSAINTLFSNGEEVLTPNEMQPSPFTPKYISPAPVVEVTLNTETKVFISQLQEFAATLEAEVEAQAEANAREEEKPKISHQEINPPAPVYEIPTFEDAFPQLQEQKTILENYSRELDENSAEYTAAQEQINVITQHIAEGISLLQQNHRLIANLAQQKKQSEILSPEKTPFKIFTSLKRGPRTPLSEKKPSPAMTTPLAPKTSSHVPSITDTPRMAVRMSMSPQKKSSVVEPSFSPLRAFVFDAHALSEVQENDGSPASSPSFPGTQLVEDDEELNFIPKNKYIVHEVLGDGECGLTAFGITRTDAYELLCDNMLRIGYLLDAAVKEAMLSQEFENYLADNGVDFDNPNQVISAYINYDVRDRQIDHGWSHPAILQALAQIQGIGLRIWRRDDQENLIPHRTNEYDYAEHIPRGATQITDLVFVNGNHFNRVEFLGNTPQPNPNHLSHQFFAAREPSQKRPRVFYLSADEAIKQFIEISSRLKEGLKEHHRIFTDEQRLDLEGIQTLFNETIASIEKLTTQVEDEKAIAGLIAYSEKISSLTENAKALSPKEFLEKAYTTFVESREERQEQRKTASPPRL